MPSHKSTKTGKTVKQATGVQKTAQKAKRTNPGRKVKQIRLISAPVVACALLKKIKKRPDSALLKAHLEAIDLHRQKYEQRLKDAKAKVAKGDVSEQHAIPSYKAKVTEAKGEYEATCHMIENYVKSKGGKDYRLLWSFSAGVGVDQLWAAGDPPTSYVIVEAKGPGATLSTNAAKGDQMSKMWVENTLESVKNSPTASAADKEHAKSMLKAMKVGPPPEVHGRVIEALPGGGAKEVGCPDKGIYHKTK